MTIELKIPRVGESVTEVQIGQWLVKPGDHVAVDQPIVELETDKATVELPSPTAGVIEKLLKQPGDVAKVEEAIALIGEGAAEATEKRPATATPTIESEPAQPIAPAAKRQAGFPTPVPKPTPTPAPGLPLRSEPKPSQVSAAPPAAPQTGTQPSGTEEEIVPMSPIRKRIAERLVAAQHGAALLTTINELDLSAVQALRHEYQEQFQQRFGVKLGLMSFFVKATIEALKAVPQLNAEIRGTDIVYHNYFDIGVAVAGGKGLVVPVLRRAERMSFAEIERAIADLAERARDNKITLAELAGGTFTITNGGVFGSLLSTPIVNPPQSGVLGMHVIQDRPVARDGAVVIRPMMYVALTYDHRIVDGREAALFLRKIKEDIENPSRMLLEV